MAYFRLSLLASWKVTELEVRSSYFIQLTFIHDLFLSFIRIQHFTRRADEFSTNSKNNLILPECFFCDLNRLAAVFIYSSLGLIPRERVFCLPVTERNRFCTEIKKKINCYMTVSNREDIDEG